jgi:hypothetical protein
LDFDVDFRAGGEPCENILPGGLAAGGFRRYILTVQYFNGLDIVFSGPLQHGVEEGQKLGFVALFA